MSDQLIQWTVRIDRRVLSQETLRQSLMTFQEGIEHLHVQMFDALLVETLPDAGTFRDFVPVAVLSHPMAEALEHIAEILLDDFGWQIDFLPYEWTHDRTSDP